MGRQMGEVFRDGSFLGEPKIIKQIAGFSLGLWRTDGLNSVEPHGHEEAHFMYVTRDSYVTGVKESSVPSPAMLIYNPPETFHADHFASGPHNFFSVTMTGKPKQASENPGLPRMPLEVASPAAKRIVAKLIKESVLWREDSLLVAEGLCLELLGEIARPAREETTRPQWLDRAVGELCADLSASPSIKKVSLAAGVTPIHFARTFRRFFGCTPGEFLRITRVKKAAHLLSRTSMTLAEVALESGFADQSHLTRRFCAVFGVPPGKFRTVVSPYYI